MNFNITAYSTALFSTWINVEELNLLIDVGDGVAAGLLQKSRKIKHVFITHPDRDHLTGLPQFVQLNAREEFPIIYYPKDSGSFPAMQSFLEKFDPHVSSINWVGIKDQDIAPIKKGYVVEAIRNEHIKTPLGVHKSFGYKVYATKKKLKPEFVGLPPEKIKELSIKHGPDYLSEIQRTNIISFSGDTPIGNYEKWQGTEILIHEATFISSLHNGKNISAMAKHSTLEEVLQMAKEVKVKKLILNHFSTRYDREEIKREIITQARQLQLQIPIYAVYPGEIKRDILSGEQVNA